MRGVFLCLCCVVAGCDERKPIQRIDGADETDPTDTSDVVDSDPAPAPPRITALRVVPERPAPGNALRCEVKVDGGDDVVVAYRWERDGADAGVDGSVVSGVALAPGQAWTCVARPSDGVSVGAEAEAEVVVRGRSLSEAYRLQEDGLDVLSVDLADVDGDGDLDLAAGTRTGVRLYLRDPTGYTWAWSSEHTHRTLAVAWEDVDGDGDPDLAAGTLAEGPVHLYRNDGGSLVKAWATTEIDTTYQLAWADADGDGDADLAVGNEAQPSRVYRNDGGALFLAWSAPTTAPTRGIAWGQFDDDAPPELVEVNYRAANVIYDRQGDGSYASVKVFGSASSYSQGAAFGALDDDAYDDLVLGHTSNQSTLVYPNRTGDFAPPFTLTGAWTEWVGFADYDLDGDDDLAESNNHDGPVRVYAYQGDDLVEVWASGTTDAHGRAAWADWDGDGDPDLVVAIATGGMVVFDNGGWGAP
ncbi:MAG: VCBS repeat-containing protein [Alphaproteobacteria bacterium]|nr:VCBS repeat-containing protein [Alphaproteobacteria bacterium]